MMMMDKEIGGVGVAAVKGRIVLDRPYNSGVFNKVSDTSPLDMSLSFVDDIGIYSFGQSSASEFAPLKTHSKELSDYS